MYFTEIDLTLIFSIFLNLKPLKLYKAMNQDRTRTNVSVFYTF